MALPIRPNNPNTPIPNNPFYAPLNPYVCGPYFPVDAGAGIDFTTTGIPAIVSNPSAVLAAGPGIALSTSGNTTTISASGGSSGVTQIIAGTNVTISPTGGTGAVTVNASGGGTVTSITAGTGLVGGTIVTSGTIDLSNTGVTQGSYTNADITVDQQGRITAAANGAPPPVSATPLIEGIVYGCTDGTNFNYGLGDNIFGSLTSGTLNIAIGTGALALTTTGTSNTAVGIGALYNNTSGNQNVAVGQQVLFTNTAGTLNVAVGSQALQNSTGNANTALGNFAGNSLTSGCNNILIGNQSGGTGGGALDTGNDNVIIGNCIAPASNSGNCQLAIGAGTICWLTGNSTGAIKPGGGIIDNANSCGANGQVLMSNGSNAICWGAVSVPAATPTVAGIVLGCTLVNNTALGCNALLAVPTGTFNTAVGASALLAVGAGCFNVGVGGFAVAANVTGCHNVGLGVNAARNALGSNNTVVGHNALFNATGGCNTVLGFQAGCSITTGGFNVAIGPEAQVASAAGSCQLAIGFSLTDNWLTGTSSKAIRPGAGIIDCAGSCGTLGQALLSNGANAVCWGSPAAAAATPLALGSVYGCTPGDSLNSVRLGFCSGPSVTGTFNTFIGSQSGRVATTAAANVAIGRNAMCGSTTASSNIAIGVDSLINASAGSQNVAVGRGTMASTSGSNNVAIGCGAGLFLTTGSNNVLIGFCAAAASATGSCQLAIGFSATDNWLTGTSTKAIKPGAGIIDCANSCGLVGEYLWTTGANAIIWASSSPSDVRDKEVIGPVPTALPIVNQIQPITYHWKDRESEVAQEEFIYGFSAQQLQEVDAVLVDDSDAEHLRIHDRKIVPLLVKAIQELSAKNDALEARIAQLEANG